MNERSEDFRNVKLRSASISHQTTVEQVNQMNPVLAYKAAVVAKHAVANDATQTETTTGDAEAPTMQHEVLQQEVQESHTEQNEPTSVTKSNPEENKKRFYVIQEIITTEMTYIDRLKITLEYVIKPLTELKVIDVADMSQQFETFGRVYELHSRHSISGSTSRNLTFVDLFEDMGQNIDIYSTYLVNYEPAMQRRAALLTSNRRFADFVDKVQKIPELQGQNLESLLILPVQRIPRYRLLLEQLLKYTTDDHPDYQTVQSALNKICELAHYNNEAIRARENNNKLMSIMMQIQPTNRPNLLDDKNRKFLKEATLQKQCRKRYKDFQFWLFSDCLLYGEMTPIGMYMLNRWLPLNQCHVSELSPGDTDFESGLIVRSPQKSFKVRTSGSIEKKEWLSLMKDAIEKYRGINTNIGVVVAPVWDPDSQSTNCSLCNAHFTLLFRRHHCRNCGKLVCTSCSSKKYHLEHVAQGLVRVCDPCYESLNPSTDKAVSVPSTQDDDADSSDDSDTSERFHEREMIDEDALDDYNDFEMELAKKGIRLTSESLQVMEEKKPPPPPPQPAKVNAGRASFFNNLTFSLSAAASALRPAVARSSVVETSSSKKVPTSPAGSSSQNDAKASPEAPSGSPRPPRRPRRPNAIRLVPLTEEQLMDTPPSEMGRD